MNSKVTLVSRLKIARITSLSLNKKVLLFRWICVTYYLQTNNMKNRCLTDNYNNTSVSLAVDDINKNNAFRISSKYYTNFTLVVHNKSVFSLYFIILLSSRLAAPLQKPTMLPSIGLSPFNSMRKLFVSKKNVGFYSPIRAQRETEALTTL